MTRLVRLRYLSNGNWELSGLMSRRIAENLIRSKYYEQAQIVEGQEYEH